MNSSDSGDRRLVKSQFFAQGAFHTEQERLPCPRCDSRETKFCYYNNYNLSQPRHYCKSCRRYWTVGGALRNVPVGGAPRKYSKCKKTTSKLTPSSPETPIAANPISDTSVPLMIPVRSALNVPPMGGFSTYVNTPGVYTLNGFGYSGFNDLGNSIWPLTLPQMVNADTSGGGGNVIPWQFGGAGDVVYSGDNECFGLPELSMGLGAAREGVK
ncbi:hypothetical protein ACHQM5_016409 [Ranunculus cassubicifolius]